MLDFVSQSAIVIGEWYIPGHKLKGFLLEEVVEASNWELRVEKMEIWFEGEDPDSIELNLELGFS